MTPLQVALLIVAGGFLAFVLAGIRTPLGDWLERLMMWDPLGLGEE